VSDPQSTPETSSRSERLKELALLFLRLGFTAFGGPPAHVATMEDEVVRRRQWLDRQHFLDLVAAVNFVPGPNSTELAIHIGLIRAGFPGLVVAGVCFIVPAVLIILPLAWMYVKWGALPEASHVLSAINAAIVAVIAMALWRFVTLAIRNVFTAIVAGAAIAFAFAARWFPQYQPDLIILASAAVAGALYVARSRVNVASLTPACLPILLSASENRQLLKASLLFLKIGATLFGSGYVLVSYLQANFIDQTGWLTRQQLLDAIAVGQITPGPLLTTATFIGYVLGQRFLGNTAGAVLGAVACTLGIFLPSFVFIAVLGRLLPAIRANPYARGALDAINAAVVAMIFIVLLGLAQASLLPHWRPSYLNLAIALGSFLALLRWEVNSTWIVLVAGIVGWTIHLIH
jgi:chromate transporter